ncbi:MAG: general secretion pathway protein GspB [Thermodesulfobacteriota bacterium]
MSFILDALKRAEHDRRLETAPDLSAVYEEDALDRRHRAWAWIGGFFILGAGLGFLVFWFTASPWGHGTSSEKDMASKKAIKQMVAPGQAHSEIRSTRMRTDTSGDASSSTQAASPRLASKPASSVEKADPEPEIFTVPPSTASVRDSGAGAHPADPAKSSGPEGTEPERPASAVQVAASPKDKPDPGPAAQEDVFEDEGVSSPEPPEKGQQTQGKADSARTIPLVSELPEEIRDALEELEINVHVYSEDPQERLVFINMRNRKVGDRIGETGPILKEITPEGVIIDYGEGLARLKVGR